MLPGAPTTHRSTGITVRRSGYGTCHIPQGGTTMTTARDIMTQGVECARSEETLADAARKMRDLDVGALPICGDDDRLKGVVTDRDLVVKCVAEGTDPTSTPV